MLIIVSSFLKVLSFVLFYFCYGVLKEDFFEKLSTKLFPNDKLVAADCPLLFAKKNVTLGVSSILGVETSLD